MRKTYDITRIDALELSTVSKITIDDTDLFIIEDTIRNSQLKSEKIYGESAIPAGKYKLSLVKYGNLHTWLSNAFKDIYKGVILLNDIPNYSGVCVHPGTSRSSTLGCLIPCLDYTIKTNDDGTREHITTKESSNNAFKLLYSAVSADILNDDTYFNISNNADLSGAINAGVIQS